MTGFGPPFLIRAVIVFGMISAAGAQIAGIAPRFTATTVQPGREPKARCGECKGQFNQEGRLIDYRGVLLADVIQMAYGLEIEPDTGPQSMWSRRYDIKATIPPETPANQLYAMLRNLLADQFKLAVRVVNKERGEYWLVVGPNGANTRSGGLERTRKGEGHAASVSFNAGPPNVTILTKWTMDRFAAELSNAVDRPVVDKTGLAGDFDIRLGYTPDGNYHGPHPGLFDSFLNIRSRGHDPAPSIPLALEDQLGLKLEPHVSWRDLLVVDYVESVPVRK